MFSSKVFLKLSLISCIGFLLTACGSEDSPDTSTPPSATNPPSQGTSDDSDTDDSTSALQFNLESAFNVQIFERAFSVRADNTANFSAGSTGLSSVMQAAASTQTSTASWGSTNFAAITAAGEYEPGVIADEPVNVTYTALAPDENSLFIILGEYHDPEKGSYSDAVMGQYNCAVYEVNLKNNEGRCAVEGQLPKIDSMYRNRNGGKQSPIAFEQSFNEAGEWIGDFYMVSTPFTSSCNERCYTMLDPSEQRLRRVNREGEPTAITTELQNVDRFIPLSEGHVLIHGYNQARGRQQLQLFEKSGQSFTVSESYLTFLEHDEYQTAIYSRSDGLRFLQPGSETGFDQVGFNFWFANSLLTTSDGILYGLTDNSLTSALPATQHPLFRMYPCEQGYVENCIRTSWGERSVALFDDYLIYVEEQNLSGLGLVDHLLVVNFITGETIRLLADDYSAMRASFYSWEQSNNYVVFSGMNQVTDEPFVGQLDIKALLAAEADEQHYLQLRTVGSAGDAINEVKAVQVLPFSSNKTYNENEAPSVELDIDKVYGSSISLFFDKPMNKHSVLKGLKLETVHGENVDFLPYWLSNTLHLIPNVNGLRTGEFGALEKGQGYALLFESTAEDMWGNPLVFNRVDFEMPEKVSVTMVAPGTDNEEIGGNAGRPESRNRVFIFDNMDNDKFELKLPWVTFDTPDRTPEEIEFNIRLQRNAWSGDGADNLGVYSQNDEATAGVAVSYRTENKIYFFYKDEHQDYVLESEASDFQSSNRLEFKLVYLEDRLKVFATDRDGEWFQVTFLDEGRVIDEIEVNRDLILSEASMYVGGNDSVLNISAVTLKHVNEGNQHTEFDITDLDVRDYQRTLFEFLNLHHNLPELPQPDYY